MALFSNVLNMFTIVFDLSERCLTLQDTAREKKSKKIVARNPKTYHLESLPF